MDEEKESLRIDWSIELEGSLPHLSPQAQASLHELGVLGEAISTLEDVFASSERVNALVRAAVAGGATEEHLASELKLSLGQAEALVHGRSFGQLFASE